MAKIYSFPPYLISYRVITYIVISKPKRISVADGVVHIVFLLVDSKYCLTQVLMAIIQEKHRRSYSEIH
jgi:hypothetical protein